MKNKLNLFFKIVVICCNLMSFSYGQRPLSANASITASTARPSLRGPGGGNGGLNSLSRTTGIHKDATNIQRTNSSTNLQSLAGIAVDRPKYQQPPTYNRKNKFSDLRRNLTAQKKVWDRQGDDPEPNIIQKNNPIWELQQKANKDVSIMLYIYVIII